MKFTPSSSVSSTTTNTTNSFTENFCTTKPNNFGCLFGFLTRILCSKTLPTYPSDPIEIDKKEHFFNIVDGSATPNVVAKLMGLDTMPEYRKVEDMDRQHHRAKTSFSFKETPDFFELEDDDFFLPSKVDKKRKKHRGRKQSKNRGDSVFSIEDRVKLEMSAQNSQSFDNNVGVRHQRYHLSSMEVEKEGIKARKKKKKKESCLVDSKEEEARECESENLSPVSVLDHSEFNSSDHEAATSGEEDVKLRRSNPGRDLPCDKNNGSSMLDDERETDENEDRNSEVGYKKRECRKHEKVEMLKYRAYRLAEEEIANNNSKWKYRGILCTQELEDASTHFAHLIFDQLVNELVDQLVEYRDV